MADQDTTLREISAVDFPLTVDEMRIISFIAASAMAARGCGPEQGMAIAFEQWRLIQKHLQDEMPRSVKNPTDQAAFVTKEHGHWIVTEAAAGWHVWRLKPDKAYYVL